MGDGKTYREEMRFQGSLNFSKGTPPYVFNAEVPDKKIIFPFRSASVRDRNQLFFQFLSLFRLRESLFGCARLVDETAFTSVHETALVDKARSETGM